MRLVFWAAVAVIGYTYVGYPLWLWLRGRWRPWPVRSGPYLPSVSIVLVVRNEANLLEAKLRNLLELDYPSAEIVVVSDGSTDATDHILAEFEKSPCFRIALKPQPRGKASGLNDAMLIATGDLVVFTDVRQKIEIHGMRMLMENFADPAVGCASGELILGDPDSGETVRGMGLYWKIEKIVREMESASGSVVGATGAFYAVRRSLLAPIPPKTILDDVFIPMQTLRQGARVVFDPRARVWDLPDLGTKREFARKVRTLSGNYQMLQLAPWLLSRANPVRFEFVSHKLFRLAVPFALCAALIASCFLPGPVYRVALLMQVGFYALGVLSLARPKPRPVARLADAAFTFVQLNAAALVAFVNFVTGRPPMWLAETPRSPARRAAPSPALESSQKPPR